MLAKFRDVTKKRASHDEYIVKLGDGTLTFEEIFDDGGHGCFINDAPGFDEVELVAVTGPKRNIARDSKMDIYFAAPHGDMMMTGCFGLVEAYKNKSKNKHKNKHKYNLK